jgi:hypothetical protein
MPSSPSGRGVNLHRRARRQLAVAYLKRRPPPPGRAASPSSSPSSPSNATHPTSRGGLRRPHGVALRQRAVAAAAGLDHILCRLPHRRTPPTGSVSYLESRQLPEGCWGFSTAGLTRNHRRHPGLDRLGVRQSAQRRGCSRLPGAAQNDDGGFPAPGDSDANSTAFVIQALVAADGTSTPAVLGCLKRHADKSIAFFRTLRPARSPLRRQHCDLSGRARPHAPPFPIVVAQEEEEEETATPTRRRPSG